MFPNGILFIHKNEWDRIRRKQKSKENIQIKEDYIQALNSLSQSWMKSWPDTVQGHVNLVEKKKEMERTKNLAFINKFLSQKKNYNREEVIQKARDQIFEDSSYGRQLISALLESKTLEERDIQIEFQKKLKDEAKLQEQSKPQWSSIESAPDMEKTENEIKRQQRERNIEATQINKAMFDRERERQAKEKQKEIMSDIEDRRALNKLIEIETQQKEKIKKMLRDDYENFMNDQKTIKEKKLQRELDNDKLVRKIREQQDRLKCKINAINEKIIKEQCNNHNSTIVYNKLQNIKEEQQKRYDKFVESGIKRQEMAQIQEDTKKQTKQKHTIQGNKICVQKYIDTCDDYTKNNNKCLCNRQCILAKSCKEQKCYKTNAHKNPTNMTPNFQVTRNKLVEEYKKRQKLPSSWSGVSASHKHFAEQASGVLQECRYKNTARRVVDDYRRLCYLDENTLPVLNY